MAHLERVERVQLRCLIPAPLGFGLVQLVGYLVAGLVGVQAGIGLGRLLVG